jgi:hypothetical protein
MAASAPHNGIFSSEVSTVKNMTAALAVVLLLASATLLHAQQPSGRKLYKWVDSQGQVHYGDIVPPEYAAQEKDIVNAQGVPIEHEDAQKSPEQQALEDQQRTTAEELRHRDQNLLNTYVSLQEIERLRDQRLSLLSDQMKVTNQFLEILNGRLSKLEKASLRYRPYSDDPKAAPMPDQVAEDLVRMDNDIRTQEQNLREKQNEETTMRAQFDSDITRFKELKGLH